MNKLQGIISSILIGIIMVCIVNLLIIPSSSQSEERRLRFLLEDLRERSEKETNFTITIVFHTPILPNQDYVVIPDRRISDEISRYISEIGEDYICFDAVLGAIREIECIPFTNIANVSYFVE